MRDARLISACDEFTATYQYLVEVAKAEDAAAYEQAAFVLDHLVATIASLTSTTMAGIRAKAQASILLWAGTVAEVPGDDGTAVLARSLLNDLVGMPDASPVVRFDQARRTFAIAGRKDGGEADRGSSRTRTGAEF